jgi:hypothetical protein
MLRHRRSKINGQWYSLFYVLDLFGSKIMASRHSFWARAKMQFSIVFAYMNSLHYYLFLGVYLGFAWMVVQQAFPEAKIKSIGALAGVDSLIIFSHVAFVLGWFHICLFYNKPERKVRAFSGMATVINLVISIEVAVLLYVYCYVFLSNKDIKGSTLNELRL